MKTVVEQLFENIDAKPDSVALIYDGEEVTYRELGQRIISVAEYFSQIGVGSSDRVILAADNTAAFVYGYFACHLSSAICVPVDPKISLKRLTYIVDKTQPIAVFIDGKNSFRGVRVAPISELQEQGRKENFAGGLGYPQKNSIADILFTSGTTGEPKGVMLSHEAIASAASHINEFIGNSADDREVMPLPLSHSFGLGRLRCNAVKGATIILVHGFTSPEAIYSAIRKYHATGLASVPAGFSILLSLNDSGLSEYAAQLKFIEIGSSPMPLDHKRKLMDLLPRTRICMHYGLTEASRSVFTEFHADHNYLNSIGKPAPGVEVQILDDYGEICPPKKMGKITIRGTHCTSGYWENDELTRRVLNDSWLFTGDIGYFDTDGYYYLQARETDIINVGGRKVVPTEIEDILKQHPLIEDCVCVGVPDPRGITGKVVRAYVKHVENCDEVLTKAELAKLLRGKIEIYKMPLDYKYINEIPKTESGKIKRTMLK
jgi:long-chain acyl-CoA synthetase